MTAFSPLSCYCRVSGMFSERDRRASVTLINFHGHGMFRIRKENIYGTRSLKSNVPVDKRG
jgi:hypothetical protein